MNRRQLTTVLHLLRYHAQYQRRMHGETLPERPGGLELTPSEMEEWANELEAAATLPDRSAVLADQRAALADMAAAKIADGLLQVGSNEDWLDT